MDIVDYLNKHNILWEPVNLINKKPDVTGTYFPKPDDYKLLDNKILKQRQETPSKFIAIFTNEIQQFDVDVEGYMPSKDIKQLPYFESITKKLPHYFCKISDVSKEQHKALGGDILSGTWAYCLRDTKVHQPENDIKTFKLGDFPERLDISKFRKTIKALKENIDDYNHDEWIKLCFAILNTATENLFTKDPHEFVTEFSKDGKKYDQKAINEISALKYDFEGLKYGTLVRELQTKDKDYKITEKKVIQKQEDGEEVEDAHEKYEAEEGIVFFEDKETTYKEFKTEWEKHAFYCEKLSQIVFYSFPDLIVSTLNSTSVYYAVAQTKSLGDIYRYGRYPMNLKTKKKSKKFEYHVDTWLTREKTKLAYYHYDFLPNPYPCPNTMFNLWKGFKFDKDVLDKNHNSTKTLNIFKEFMEHTGKSHPKLPEFLTHLLANIIQNPGSKEGIICILTGPEGTFKGTRFRLIKNLLGSAYCSEVTDPEKLIGRFNIGLMKKLYCVFDEAVSIEMIQKTGKLKGLATDLEYTYEQKGKDVVEGHNFTRVEIHTNESIGAKAANSDRRNLYIESSKMSDQLRIAINEVIDDEEACKCIFKYLQNLPIPYRNSKEWQSNRPITEKHLEVIAHFTDPIYELVGSYINKKIDYISSKQLYSDYEAHMTNYPAIKNLKSVREMGLFMTKLEKESSLVERGRDNKNTRGYKFCEGLKEYLLTNKFIQKEEEVQTFNNIVFGSKECEFDSDSDNE